MDEAVPGDSLLFFYSRMENWSVKHADCNKRIWDFMGIVLEFARVCYLDNGNLTFFHTDGSSLDYVSDCTSGIK